MKGETASRRKEKQQVDQRRNNKYRREEGKIDERNRISIMYTTEETST